MDVVVLYLLIIFSAFATFSTTSAIDVLTLAVGESKELHVVPSVPVDNSPGSKPGFSIFAERVHIHGLSRMKNLHRFSYAVSVKVSYLNSSLRLPNAEICFHRNLSLGVGMCSQGQWQKLSKDSWSQKMSPFDHKLLDVRMAGPSLEALKLTLEEEFSAYRTVFLVLGTLLIMLGPTFSESLVFYYSSAMVVGIILVILIVLFQGMKLLPTGRGNSLAIFLYSSLIGVGSFLTRYLPRLLRMMLAEIGVSEDMHNPLVMFLMVFISLGGAWLGFWVVRKLILTEDGSIDATVSQFVAWSIRILGAVMILQCSLDPLLAAEALVSAICISSILRKATRPRLLRRLYRKFRRARGSTLQKSSNYDSSPSEGTRFEDIDNFQNSQKFRSPTSQFTSRPTAYSPLKDRKFPPPLSESGPFYSTYHKTPERRKFSDDEWKSFTKECTKRELENLVSSPEFGRWAVAHAERITLAPVERQQTTRWRRWLFWFR
ncbi:uncharacterized protein LOC141643559 isoform X2 [Silene latifolia]|uniref:uncharacterized protein LOC141643559 isoform X2 n=1 Tax=Silene latifolia TaxID=37657 RepID=UPI003D775C30